MYRDLIYVEAAPAARRAPALAAELLGLAGALLDRMAARLARLQARLQARARAVVRAQARAGQAPVIEFHAEAGAPEGALYVDGQLVGHVLGVSRL